MKRPEDRISVMEGSLRCFALGLLSLIPPVGLIMLPMILIIGHRVRITAEDTWNPAKRFLAWGYYLAQVGGFLSLVFVVLAAIWCTNTF